MTEPSKRSNFTMLPNIAFDLLTNEYDLVGYQKLLRFIGMGGVWKGGNHALAKKLGISYGRIPKLKTALVSVGFVEIVPGDNAHGEADEWHLLDIWDRNTLSPNEQGQTLSQNEQALSPDEQGQDTLSQNEQGQNSANTGENTNQEPDSTLSPDEQPLSRNEQATLSRNEQRLKKIFSKENIQDTEFANAHYSASGENSGGEKNPPERPPPEEQPKTERRRDLDFERLAEMCFLVEPGCYADLSGKQRGQLNQTLKKMREQDFDLSKIPRFDEWWKSNWRSGFGTKTYEPPRPDQVKEFWNVAMKSGEIAREIKKENGKSEHGAAAARTDPRNNPELKTTSVRNAKPGRRYKI